MSELKNFRKSFRGFNRQDVVNYIEYINNTHNAQVEQLNNQLQAALAQPSDEELKARLEAAEARVAELEAALAEQDRAILSDSASCTEQELEAYRRAERVERVAKERAEQIYAQANGVMAEGEKIVFKVHMDDDDIVSMCEMTGAKKAVLFHSDAPMTCSVKERLAAIGCEGLTIQYP